MEGEVTNYPEYPIKYVIDGYYILFTDNLENAKREHRYVVEQNIGRKLKRKEIVHHIDMDKLNNDYDNLRIMSQEQHRQLHYAIRRVKKIT